MWRAHERGCNPTSLTHGDSGVYWHRRTWHPVGFSASLFSWLLFLSYNWEGHVTFMAVVQVQYSTVCVCVCVHVRVRVHVCASLRIVLAFVFRLTYLFQPKLSLANYVLSHVRLFCQVFYFLLNGSCWSCREETITHDTNEVLGGLMDDFLRLLHAKIDLVDLLAKDLYTIQDHSNGSHK